MIDYETEILLERWGRWARNTGINIDYKPTTFFADQVGSTVSSAQLSDAEALEVDAAICNLKRLSSEEGEAVTIFYTHNCNTTYVARRMHMSRAKADKLIKTGTAFISGLLFGRRKVA